MRGVKRAVEGVICNQALLLFRELFDPDVDEALQAPSSEVRKRRVAAELCSLRRSIGSARGLDDVGLELEALSELLRETRKLLLAGECAENNKDLLPLLQVGVLNDVVEIVGDNGLEETEVRERSSPALEVSLLSAGQELGTTLDSEKDGIRETVSG